MVGFLLASVAIAGVMILVGADARRRGKLDGVDIGWAGGILAATYCFAIAEWFMGDTPPSLHGGLAILMISLWSIRLIWHLYVDRLVKPEEDGRYRYLKEQWGSNAPRNIRIFFVAQGVIALLFALAPFSAIVSGGKSLTLALIGVAIFSLALWGESIADGQLARFRSKPENRGMVCNVGLWRYSRHPNYFFEWCIWWAYLPLAGSLWWLALLPIGLLYYLFRHVTGIPPTEAQSLRSRGERYREYQRTTSPFFPWFPKLL